MWQTLIADLIVAGAAAYAAWALMPAAWQRALSRRLLGREPAAAGGCGSCGGGCAPTPAQAAAPQVIRIHRHPPAQNFSAPR